MATEGYGEFFHEQVPEWKWSTAAEFRNRHIHNVADILTVIARGLVGGGS